jgi:hypothetical protein
MKTFDEQIMEVMVDRRNEEFWRMQRFTSKGEDIYARFEAWCNAYNGGNGKTDCETFDRYCQQWGIEVDFWKRKAIGENHFGERYKWTGEKWEITK